MTLGVTESPEIEVAPAVPREAAEKVLRYLVFHRSLLGENDDGSALLERYLGLVEKLKEGLRMSSSRTRTRRRPRSSSSS